MLRPESHCGEGRGVQEGTAWANACDTGSGEKGLQWKYVLGTSGLIWEGALDVFFLYFSHYQHHLLRPARCTDCRQRLWNGDPNHISSIY